MLFPQEKEKRFALQGFSVMIACDHYTISAKKRVGIMCSSPVALKAQTGRDKLKSTISASFADIVLQFREIGKERADFVFTAFRRAV